MTEKEIKLLRDRMKKEDPKLLVLMEKCFDAGVLSGKEQAEKERAKQEPWRESASDYERGVIDGRMMQVQSSVDKAVNAMSQPSKPLTNDQIAKFYGGDSPIVLQIIRDTEAAHGIKENT